jgi:hypothetical protein
VGRRSRSRQCILSVGGLPACRLCGRCRCLAEPRHAPQSSARKPSAFVRWRPPVFRSGRRGLSVFWPRRAWWAGGGARPVRSASRRARPSASASASWGGSLCTRAEYRGARRPRPTVRSPGLSGRGRGCVRAREQPPGRRGSECARAHAPARAPRRPRPWPNLAVSGSLSAILWLQVARASGARPSAARYSLIGAVVAPVTLVLALGALAAAAPHGVSSVASRRTVPSPFLTSARRDRLTTKLEGRRFVVGCVNNTRTQNGHIRNDTRDVSRRVTPSENDLICRRMGKEGVDGSSPSEGFGFPPAQLMFLLSWLAVVTSVGVHAASTSVHRGRCPALSSSSRRIACSRPSRARWP